MESESLWYNYGFDSLSNNVGAINNVNFRPHLVEHFRKFVLEKLELPTDTGTKMHDVAVMFESDKFQNIHEIKTILQHHFKLKVTLVNPKMVSTKELIWIMSKSQMLIAFAQSFNVFSLFLPKMLSGELTKMITIMYIYYFRGFLSILFFPLFLIMYFFLYNYASCNL